MVFEGTTGVYERIYCFNSKWVWKKVKYANSKWVWKARSENGYGFQRSGLKVGVENDICLAWNRVRILTTRWHAPTKNSHEYPPGVRELQIVVLYNLMVSSCFFCCCFFLRYCKKTNEQKTKRLLQPRFYGTLLLGYEIRITSLKTHTVCVTSGLKERAYVETFLSRENIFAIIPYLFD